MCGPVPLSRLRSHAGVFFASSITIFIPRASPRNVPHVAVVTEWSVHDNATPAAAGDAASLFRAGCVSILFSLRHGFEKSGEVTPLPQRPSGRVTCRDCGFVVLPLSLVRVPLCACRITLCLCAHCELHFVLYGPVWEGGCPFPAHCAWGVKTLWRLSVSCTGTRYCIRLSSVSSCASVLNNPCAVCLSQPCDEWPC